MENKTVAIVGNGRTRVLADHDDRSVDVWTLNDHAVHWGKHTDAVFEMHPDALHARRYSDEYKAWLQREHPFPIYMHKKHYRIPSSVTYPLKDIMAWFPKITKGGRTLKYFFTSSVPYMLALATHKKYETIKLIGVDLERDIHAHMKDAIFFYMGIAAYKGIQIDIAEGSALMDEALYPDIMPKRRMRP